MTQPATAPTPPLSADQIVCPNPACSAPNRAGTRFCASCGTSLAGLSGVAAPGTPIPPHIPAAPSVPPPRPNFAGNPGAVPTDRTLDVPLATHLAYAQLTEALQSMSADITHPAHPTGLLAVIPYKSLGTPLRFRCQAILQPNGPTATRLSYGIKVDWSSTFVVLGILVAIGLVNIMFLGMWVGVLAPLCSIGGIGWAVYDYAVGMPNKLAAQLQKKLAAMPAAQPAYSAPAPVQAAPQAPAPAPAVMLTKTPAPATPAPSGEDDVIAKIEKLAVLKTKGLISEAEFEQRRTELLDRL